MGPGHLPSAQPAAGAAAVGSAGQYSGPGQEQLARRCGRRRHQAGGQRDTEGGLTGALVIERNVLEWRFDPTSDARLPIADYDLEVIVICQEGYTSSLAAASLHDLGIHRATDVIGGYAAWRELL